MRPWRSFPEGCRAGARLLCCAAWQGGRPLPAPRALQPSPRPVRCTLSRQRAPPDECEQTLIRLHAAVADDDLFSLDFTRAPPPPAVPATPAPVAPPAAAPAAAAKPTLELVPVDKPAPATVAAAEPPAPAAAPAAAPARRVPPPAALLEAAHLFARGDDLGASKRLEAALKSGEALGDHARRVWLALFDVLHVMNRYDAYTKLALAFAKRFETSPPAWRDAPVIETAPDLSALGEFALPARLDGAIGDALRDIGKRIGGQDRITLDARGVTAADDNGCILLLRLLTSLKKTGRPCAVRGSDALVALLTAQAEVGERKHEPVWLLLLDLLQRAGNQEAFEEAAINFAVTFELSPPSWDPAAVVEAPPEAAVGPAASPVAAPTDALVGELKGCRADAFVGMFAPAADGTDRVIDASSLVRLDDQSATALTQAAGAAAGLAGKIIVTGLPQLAEVLLREHGMGEHAELQLRTC